jgi:hypothetical protein
MSNKFDLPSLPSKESKLPGFTLGQPLVEGFEESKKAATDFLEQMKDLRLQMNECEDKSSKEYISLLKAYKALREITDDSSGLEASRRAQLAAVLEAQRPKGSDEEEPKQPRIKVIQ